MGLYDDLTRLLSGGPPARGPSTTSLYDDLVDLAGPAAPASPATSAAPTGAASWGPGPSASFLPPTPISPAPIDWVKDLYHGVQTTLGIPAALMDKGIGALTGDDQPGSRGRALWSIWKDLKSAVPMTPEEMILKAARDPSGALVSPDTQRLADSYEAFEAAVGTGALNLVTDPAMALPWTRVGKLGTAFFLPGLAESLGQEYQRVEQAWSEAGGKITPELASAVGTFLTTGAMTGILAVHGAKTPGGDALRAEARAEKAQTEGAKAEVAFVSELWKEAVPGQRPAGMGPEVPTLHTAIREALSEIPPTVGSRIVDPTHGPSTILREVPSRSGDTYYDIRTQDGKVATVKAEAPPAPEGSLEAIAAKLNSPKGPDLFDLSFLPEAAHEPFWADLKSTVKSWETTPDQGLGAAAEAFAAQFPERYAPIAREKFIQLAYSRAQGMDFMAEAKQILADKFPDNTVQDPKTGVPVEVYGTDPKNAYYVVRDAQGEISGAGAALNGGIVSVFGGSRVMDFPDIPNVAGPASSSAGPIYRTMKAAGIESSKTLTPAGEAAQRRAFEAGLDTRGGKETYDKPIPGPPEPSRAGVAAPRPGRGPTLVSPPPDLSQGSQAPGGPGLSEGPPALGRGTSREAVAQTPPPFDPTPFIQPRGSAEPAVWEWEAVPSAEAPPSAPPPPAPTSPGPPTPEDFPKYAGSLNLWQRTDSPEGVREVYLAVYNKFQETIDLARRGVVKIAEQKRLAENLGLTEEAFVRARRPTYAFQNAEQLHAANAILENSAKDLWHLNQEALHLGTDAAKVEFLRALQSHVLLQTEFSAATTESARIVGAMNRLRSPLPETVRTALEDWGKHGKRLDSMMQALADIDPNDVVGINGHLRRATKPTVGGMLREAYLAWVLSGVPSHVANALSGVISSVAMPMEAGFAAAADALRYNVSTGLRKSHLLAGEATPRARFLGEIPAMLKSLGVQTAHRELTPADGSLVGFQRGLREGIAAAAQTWKTEISRFETAQASEAQAAGQIPGKIGRVIRTPLRVLLATDEFWKTVFQRMELNAQAYASAMKAGKKGSVEIAQHMATTLDGWKRNPAAAEVEAATQSALYWTLNVQPGELGQSLLRLRRHHPNLIWLVPVLRTPINSVNFAIERTPVKAISFARALWDYNHGRMDARTLSTEAAKTMTGLLLFAGVAELVASGRITGAGPKDKAKRDTLLATGWLPYALRVGGDYHQFLRVDPFGTSVGMVADFVEAMQGGMEAQDVPGHLIHAFTRQLQDKPFISGIAGLFKTIMDDERYGPTFARRTLGSIVPNIVAYGARALDPTRREPRTFLETLRSRIPGLSERVLNLEEVPAYLDIYGRPVDRPPAFGSPALGAVERFTSPIFRSEEKQDEVTPHLLRLKLSITTPSKKLEINGKDAPLTVEDRQLLRMARGMGTYVAAHRVVTAPDFLTLPVEDQRDLLERNINAERNRVSRTARALIQEGLPFTLEALLGEVLTEDLPPGLPD